MAVTVLPMSHFLFTKLSAKYVHVHSTHFLYKDHKTVVELLALATTRVSLRKIDTVPGDVSHKTPFRVLTVLKKGRRTAKREDGVWPLGWSSRGRSKKELKQKIKWSDTDFE